MQLTNKTYSEFIVVVLWTRVAPEKFAFIFRYEKALDTTENVVFIPISVNFSLSMAQKSIQI